MSGFQPFEVSLPPTVSPAPELRHGRTPWYTHHVRLAPHCPPASHLYPHSWASSRPCVPVSASFRRWALPLGAGGGDSPRPHPNNPQSQKHPTGAFLLRSPHAHLLQEATSDYSSPFFIILPPEPPGPSASLGLLRLCLSLTSGCTIVRF